MISWTPSPSVSGHSIICTVVVNVIGHEPCVVYEMVYVPLVEPLTSISPDAVLIISPEVEENVPVANPVIVGVGLLSKGQ